MRFSVRHETLYRYSAPVQFAPHLLRLNPRPEGVRMLSRLLTVSPQPIDRQEIVDAYGNHLTRVAFQGASSELRIESAFELETLAALEMVPVRAALLPLPWPTSIADDLEVYRRLPDGDLSVRAFAQAVAADGGQDPRAFLARLTEALHSSMDKKIRTDGAAQDPATTLATRTGACRDITVLFLAACRSLGMPARFVSGYQSRSQTPDGQRYLHAWAEVFLPGAGWSAWDPTHGVPVTDGHVALCAGPDQATTMPVEGAYYGPARTATLDFSLRIATDGASH
jgi:transglutaminase-like putative cysteine protease